MATILETIQSFCHRVNIPAPSAIVGVSSPAEQQYLSLFTMIGDNLRNRPYAWPQLKRGYTFTTQTGVRRYQLPGDFYRLLDSSQWDVTNNWPLRGPISDFQYTTREYAVVSLQTRKAFRVIGPVNYIYNAGVVNGFSAGTIEIDPAGENNTDELFLGYMSSNWLQAQPWTPNTVYAANAIRTGDGLMYVTTAGGTSGTTRPNWTTGSDSDGGVTWTVYRERYWLTPTAYAQRSDNDICLFDNDLMVEGMRWAYYRAKKQDYTQERADWEQMVKSAYSRFNGRVRINMSDEYADLFEWPNVPPGSWSV